MNDNAFWAVLICALLASCVADEAIQAYREAHKPAAAKVDAP